MALVLIERDAGTEARGREGGEPGDEDVRRGDVGRGTALGDVLVTGGEVARRKTGVCDADVA